MASAVPDDFSPGELARGIQRIETALHDLAGKVDRHAETSDRERREDAARVDGQIETAISVRLRAQGERIGRLEKVVYGAVGLILVSVLAGLLTLVIRTSP